MKNQGNEVMDRERARFETKRVMSELIEAIRRHTEEISNIAGTDAGIAGFVWKPCPSIKPAARALGWPGGERPWRLSASAMSKLAGTDSAARRFVEERGQDVRLFVPTGVGSLLLTCGPDGWSLSGTDQQLAAENQN